MNQSQTNSARNLQHLYSTVIGLSFSLAIYNIVDTSRVDIPFKTELLPFFFAFLVTLIPFYHGALRHLDTTYIEQAGNNVRKGALLMDFSALFIESCILLVLAVLLNRPVYFMWGIVVLFVFDIIWALAFWGFSQKNVRPKTELRWATINFVFAVLLTAFLLVIDFKFPNIQLNNLVLVIGIISITSIRTFVDYKLCWDFYFPSLK